MRQILDAVGFVGVEIGPVRYDAFSDAPNESSSAEFGTEGITVRAWKRQAASRVATLQPMAAAVDENGHASDSMIP